MLTRADTLKKYSIQASDEEAGSVDDFYFSDDSWSVRYIVVETGSWLFGRRVLMSPAAFDQPIGDGVLNTALTSEQVKESPDIDLELPVSRQNETALHDYYGWPYYWVAVSNPVGAWAGGAAAAPIPVNAKQGEPDQPETEADAQPKQDPNLRSVDEVTGYGIEASDGEIGHVEDFIIDDEEWVIRYIVVNTRNWLPGRKVLVAPDWIKDVSWDTMKVYVDITREQVEQSPVFDPARPIERSYEEELYKHYKARHYWM